MSGRSSMGHAPSHAFEGFQEADCRQGKLEAHAKRRNSSGPKPRSEFLQHLRQKYHFSDKAEVMPKELPRLRDLKGYFHECAMDQQGSKLIQEIYIRQLSSITDEEKSLIFEELFPHLPELIRHVFGNYII